MDFIYTKKFQQRLPTHRPDPENSEILLNTARCRPKIGLSTTPPQKKKVAKFSDFRLFIKQTVSKKTAIFGWFFPPKIRLPVGGDSAIFFNQFFISIFIDLRHFRAPKTISIKTRFKQLFPDLISIYFLKIDKNW